MPRSTPVRLLTSIGEEITTTTVTSDDFHCSPLVLACVNFIKQQVNRRGEVVKERLSTLGGELKMQPKLLPLPVLLLFQSILGFSLAHCLRLGQVVVRIS